MKKFRIKVDLSTFFSDERKLALILIDKTWDKVQCLQRRVEHIFEVNNVRFITSEGCFVPPEEPIQVLKSNDVLKAFVPFGNMKKKRKKDKGKNLEMVDGSGDYDNGDVEKLKKRKRDLNPQETGFTSSTPQPKRSKSLLAVTIAPHKNNTVDEITSTSEQLGLKYGKQKALNNNLGSDVDSMETNENTENLLAKQSKTISIATEEGEGSAKKRKRKKKNKYNPKPIESVDVLNTSSSSTLKSNEKLLDKPTTSNGYICSLVQDKSKQNEDQRNHCYFNESGETVSTTTEYGASEMGTKVIFRCPLSEVSYDKPRVFSLNKSDPATPEDDDLIAYKKPKSPVIIEELLILPKLMTPMDGSIIVEGAIANETINYGPVEEATDKEATDKEATEIEATNKEGIENETVENEETETERCDNEECQKETENETPDNENNEKQVAEKENGNNETAIDDDDDVETSKDHSAQDTTAADDSSVIAIESENEDFSIIDEDRDASTEHGDDVSEIIDLNASDDEAHQSTATADVRKKTGRKQLTIDEMLPFSVELEMLPKHGEIIIFKLQRFDRKRSEFIAGKCDYVNKRTKVIKMHVIDGNKEISGLPHRFKCPLDISTATDKDYLQIKLNELLDAKLFTVN